LVHSSLREWARAGDLDRGIVTLTEVF